MNLRALIFGAIAVSACSSGINASDPSCDPPPLVVLGEMATLDLTNRGIDVRSAHALVLEASESSPLKFDPAEFPAPPTADEMSVYTELGVEYGLQSLTPFDNRYLASFEREDRMLSAACWLSTLAPSEGWSLESIQQLDTAG